MMVWSLHERGRLGRIGRAEIGRVILVVEPYAPDLARMT
jgi:hypothetical protein